MIRIITLGLIIAVPTLILSMMGVSDIKIIIIGAIGGTIVGASQSWRKKYNDL